MKTKHVLLCCLTFITIASSTYAEDIAALISQASPKHPRLFITAKDDISLRNKARANKDVFKSIRAISDKLMEQPTLTRKKTGRRLLSVSRECLKRTTHLGMTYRITKDKKYAARAQKEMLATASFTDWNPSHFLDVAEMTAALAIGYDWCFEALDPEARTIIKQAIIEKGLKTSLKGGWWVTTHNNWNQVCHGGLTLGALAVLEDEPELATKIIARAVKYIPNAMQEYAPDGAYPEGPSYWNYGTTYNVLFIAAVESTLGTDFGLTKSKGFMECSDYYLHATGPTGLYFNYSDCGKKGSIAPAMFWFAARRKNNSLLWNEARNLKGGKSGRLHPFILIWASNIDKTPMPKTLHWKSDGKNPISMHRSGWKDDDIFLGFKAGSPSVNHAHMDVGSFVFDADGVRWAIDLGSQNYHSLESKGIKLFGKNQNSQRWTVFRTNSLSHNTLVVDGKKQIVNGKAPIVNFSDKGDMPHTIIDMTSVYAGQLASAKRGIGLHKANTVLIQDEIKTLPRETSVRWGMVTKSKIKITGNKALLKQDGKQLTLEVLSPKNAKLETYETAKPPADYDYKNTGTKMIGFTVTLPASTESKLIVQLTPGKSKPITLPIQTLTEW